MRLHSCLLVMLVCGMASGALASRGSSYDYHLEKGMSPGLQEQYRKVCDDPQSYYHKNIKADANDYNPDKKDFRAVIEECRGIGKNEKRFFNFVIRTTFHDALAIDPKKITGGADGSIFFEEELNRRENQGFAAAILRAIVSIADRYDVSIADTLAVCGAVAAEELAGNRFQVIGADGKQNFPVGRIDATEPNADGQLLGSSADNEEFVQWWKERGFETDEAVALMGAHALLKPLGCTRSSRPGDVCDPTREDCSEQVRMFKWNVHFYEDACTNTINILDRPIPARRANTQDFQEMARNTMCQFTSQGSRNAALQSVQDQMRDGSLNTRPVNVHWTNENCEASRQLGFNNCPHQESWPYTTNDAHLGQACQGFVNSAEGQEVKDAMIEYLNQTQWDIDFTTAYIKMMTKFANFKNVDGKLLHIGSDGAGSFLEPTAQDKSADGENKDQKESEDGAEWRSDDNDEQDNKWDDQDQDEDQDEDDSGDEGSRHHGWKKHHKRRGRKHHHKSRSWGRHESW